MNPTTEQQDYINSNSNVSILNGGPGTGKTYSVAEKIKNTINIRKNLNIVILTKCSSVSESIIKKLNTSEIKFTKHDTHNYCYIEKDEVYLHIMNLAAFIHLIININNPNFNNDNGQKFNKKQKEALRISKNNDCKELYIKNRKTKENNNINILVIDEYQDLTTEEALIISNLQIKLGFELMLSGDFLQSVFFDSSNNSIKNEPIFPRDIFRKYNNAQEYFLTESKRCPHSHVMFVNKIMEPFYEKYDMKPLTTKKELDNNLPVMFSYPSNTNQNNESALLAAQKIIKIVEIFKSEPHKITIISKGINNSNLVDILNNKIKQIYSNHVLFKTSEDDVQISIDFNKIKNNDKCSKCGKKVYKKYNSCQKCGTEKENICSYQISICGMKGNENEIIIALGFTNGSFPRKNSINTIDELQDISNCFVSLTRSTNYLFIGYTENNLTQYINVFDTIDLAYYTGEFYNFLYFVILLFPEISNNSHIKKYILEEKEILNKKKYEIIEDINKINDSNILKCINKIKEFDSNNNNTKYMDKIKKIKKNNDYIDLCNIYNNKNNYEKLKYYKKNIKNIILQKYISKCLNELKQPEVLKQIHNEFNKDLKEEKCDSKIIANNLPTHINLSITNICKIVELEDILDSENYNNILNNIKKKQIGNNCTFDMTTNSTLLGDFNNFLVLNYNYKKQNTSAKENYKNLIKILKKIKKNKIYYTKNDKIITILKDRGYTNGIIVLDQLCKIYNEIYCEIKEKCNFVDDKKICILPYYFKDNININLEEIFDENYEIKKENIKNMWNLFLLYDFSINKSFMSYIFNINMPLLNENNLNSLIDNIKNKYYLNGQFEETINTIEYELQDENIMNILQIQHYETFTISGRMDHYEENNITEFKLSSSEKIKDSWILQCILYSLIGIKKKQFDYDSDSEYSSENNIEYIYIKNIKNISIINFYTGVEYIIDLSNINFDIENIFYKILKKFKYREELIEKFLKHIIYVLSS